MTEPLKNTDIQGRYQGQGGFCAPTCCTYQIEPCCLNGICVVAYCWGCPFGCKAFISCDNSMWMGEGLHTIQFTGKDQFTNYGCGEFKKVSGGGTSPSPAVMVRAPDV